MGIITIIFISTGLAMDAFAVSIVYGVTINRKSVPQAFKIAFSFGLFQAIMPLFGWLAGQTLKDFIASVDHWIAFIVLTYIGVKMIYEALKRGRCRENECGNLYIPKLIMLSLATSIDALAVGLTFAFLNISIIYPVIIFGLMTFVLSFIGFFAGNKLGRVFSSKIEIFGGCILIGIGLKILLEDLFFK